MSIPYYYTTEKIWHSIEAGCLPIYFGKNSSIYEDFPKNSFIDYPELFNHPSQLYEFIDNLAFVEYQERLNKCIAVFNLCMCNKFDYGNRLKKLSMKFLHDKIEYIASLLPHYLE